MRDEPMDWNAVISDGDEFPMTVRELCAAIGERVSCREIGERYGLPVNRAGFTRCLWHNEKTESLKLYDEPARKCHCFGCNHTWDAVGLTAQILHVDTMSAIRIINREYNLDLPLTARELTPAELAAKERRERARRAAAALEVWRRQEMNRLDSLIRMANLLTGNPDEWTPQQMDALRHREQYESRSDWLRDATTAELLDAWRESRKAGDSQ